MALMFYRVCFDRLGLHMQVPHFDGQVIPGDHVAPRVGKLDVRYRGDDFGEEAAVRWIFWLFEHCREETWFRKYF